MKSTDRFEMNSPGAIFDLSGPKPIFSRSFPLASIAYSPRCAIRSSSTRSISPKPFPHL